MSFSLKLEKDPSLKKPQKLFFVLFGFLFLAAPFYYQPNLGGEGLFLPHNSSLWIIATILLASASLLIFKTKSLVLPKYWIGLALLPIGTILTGFIADNNNPTEWLTRVMVIVGGYIFLIALFQFRLSHAQIEQSLYLLLATGLITATYGIIQIQGLSSALGFLPRSINHTPVGIFQQINMQASMMATLLALSYYLASRPSLISLNVLVKLTLCAAAGASAYIIATSGSRVGLLGAFLAMLFIVIARWKFLTSRKVLLSFLVLSTLTGAYLGSAGLSTTGEKFSRSMGGIESDIRWKIYLTSWNLFTEEPLTGHGVGSFQSVFQEKRSELQTTEQLNFGNFPRLTHPHNELIFWLVEGGIIAILGILAATITTLIRLFKIGWHRGLAYTGLMIPIVLHAQVELPFYISNIHWFFLLTFLFLCHQHDKKTVEIGNLSLTAQLTIPVVFTVVAIVSSAFLIRAQVANMGVTTYVQKRESYPVHLSSAITHSYFRDIATYMILRRHLILDKGEGERKAAEQFIVWAEDHLRTVPAIPVHRDLVRAYHILGETDKRDEAMEKALSIYQNSPELLKYRKTYLQQEDQN